MFATHLLELGKLNVCVIRLNSVTQSCCRCLCSPNRRNVKRLRLEDGQMFKRAVSINSCPPLCFVCHKCGSWEATKPWLRPTSLNTYLLSSAPEPKTGSKVCRRYKSGSQSIVAPLYPTKHKCLTKVPNPAPKIEEISRQRGLSFDNIKKEMRKIAYKIKQDQWARKIDVLKDQARLDEQPYRATHAIPSAQKLLGKEWNQKNDKVVFESKSLRQLKDQISKKIPNSETAVSIKLPHPAVDTLQTSGPSSGHLYIRRFKIKPKHEESPGKFKPSSLPSPYFFLQKKLNEETLACSLSRPKTQPANLIQSKVSTSNDKAFDGNETSTYSPPCPRLLQDVQAEKFSSDPKAVQRQIDTVLRNVHPRKSGLDILSSKVANKQDTSLLNRLQEQKSLPSPNLKDCGQLYSLRDEVPNSIIHLNQAKEADTTAKKFKANENSVVSTANVSLKFDEYFRNLDKIIREKGKAKPLNTELAKYKNVSKKEQELTKVTSDSKKLEDANFEKKTQKEIVTDHLQHFNALTKTIMSDSIKSDRVTQPTSKGKKQDVNSNLEADSGAKNTFSRNTTVGVKPNANLHFSETRNKIIKASNYERTSGLEDNNLMIKMNQNQSADKGNSTNQFKGIATDIITKSNLKINDSSNAGVKAKQNQKNDDRYNTSESQSDENAVKNIMNSLLLDIRKNNFAKQSQDKSSRQLEISNSTSPSDVFTLNSNKIKKTNDDKSTLPNQLGDNKLEDSKTKLKSQVLNSTTNTTKPTSTCSSSTNPKIFTSDAGQQEKKLSPTEAKKDEISSVASTVNKVCKDMKNLNEKLIEEVNDSQKKKAVQNINVGQDNPIFDKSLHVINSLSKKGIHSKSSFSSDKRHKESDDKWEHLSLNREDRNDLRMEDEREPREKNLHLFTKRIVEVTSPIDDYSNSYSHSERLHSDDFYRMDDNARVHHRKNNEWVAPQGSESPPTHLRNAGKYHQQEEISQPQVVLMAKSQNAESNDDNTHFQEYESDTSKPSRILNELPAKDMNRRHETKSSTSHLQTDQENMYAVPRNVKVTSHPQPIQGRSAPYYPTNSEPNYIQDAQIQNQNHAPWSDEAENRAFKDQSDLKDGNSSNSFLNYPNEKTSSSNHDTTSKREIYRGNDGHHSQDDQSSSIGKPKILVEHSPNLGKGKFRENEQQSSFRDEETNRERQRKHMTSGDVYLKSDNPQKSHYIEQNVPVEGDNMLFQEDNFINDEKEPSKFRVLGSFETVYQHYPDYENEILKLLSSTTKPAYVIESDSRSEYVSDPFQKALAKNRLLKEMNENNQEPPENMPHKNVTSVKPSKGRPAPSSEYEERKNNVTEMRNSASSNSLDRTRLKQLDPINAEYNEFNDHSERSKNPSSSKPFDINEALRESIKKKRDILIESEVRQRFENEPFEYTLAEESKRSFEELKDMVKNEMQFSNIEYTRKDILGSNGFSETKSFPSSKIEVKTDEMQSVADTSNSHSESYKNHAVPDSNAVPYSTPKHLKNSYYHIDKAKTSLEKYFEDAGVIVRKSSGNQEGPTSNNNRQEQEYGSIPTKTQFSPRQDQSVENKKVTIKKEYERPKEVYKSHQEQSPKQSETHFSHEDVKYRRFNEVRTSSNNNRQEQEYGSIPSQSQQDKSIVNKKVTIKKEYVRPKEVYKSHQEQSPKQSETYFSNDDMKYRRFNEVRTQINQVHKTDEENRNITSGNLQPQRSSRKITPTPKGKPMNKAIPKLHQKSGEWYQQYKNRNKLAAAKYLEKTHDVNSGDSEYLYSDVPRPHTYVAEFGPSNQERSQNHYDQESGSERNLYFQGSGQAKHEGDFSVRRPNFPSHSSQRIPHRVPDHSRESQPSSFRMTSDHHPSPSEHFPYYQYPPPSNFEPSSHSQPLPQHNLYPSSSHNYQYQPSPSEHGLNHQYLPSHQIPNEPTPHHHSYPSYPFDASSVPHPSSNSQQIPHRPSPYSHHSSYLPPVHSNQTAYQPPSHSSQTAYQPPIHSNQTVYQPPSHSNQTVHQPPSHSNQTVYQPPSHSHQPAYQPPSHSDQTAYQPPIHSDQTAYQPPSHSDQTAYQPPHQFGQTALQHPSYQPHTQPQPQPSPLLVQPEQKVHSVTPSQQPQDQDKKIREYFQDYYSKPNATGAIDTMPPYLVNDSYGYKTDESKHSNPQSYSQFKNTNVSNITENSTGTGSRRNSHTIVSPSPFFSTPSAYPHEDNSLSNNYNQAQELRQSHSHSSVSQVSSTSKGHSGFSPLSYLNKNVSEFKHGHYGVPAGDPLIYGDSSLNDSRKNENYSLGIDQLLSSQSEQESLRNKVNNFLNPIRTESSKISSTMFNKITNNRPFSLFDVPRQVSGYIQRLANWNHIKGYRYGDSSSVYNLYPVIEQPKAEEKRLPLLEIPVEKGGPGKLFKKLALPAIVGKNKNVDKHNAKNNTNESNQPDSNSKSLTVAKNNDLAKITEESESNIIVSEISPAVKNNNSKSKRNNLANNVKDMAVPIKEEGTAKTSQSDVITVDMTEKSLSTKKEDSIKGNYNQAKKSGSRSNLLKILLQKRTRPIEESHNAFSKPHVPPKPEVSKLKPKTKNVEPVLLSDDLKLKIPVVQAVSLANQKETVEPSSAIANKTDLSKPKLEKTATSRPKPNQTLLARWMGLNRKIRKDKKAKAKDKKPLLPERKKTVVDTKSAEKANKNELPSSPIQVQQEKIADAAAEDSKSSNEKVDSPKLLLSDVSENKLLEVVDTKLAAGSSKLESGAVKIKTLKKKEKIKILDTKEEQIISLEGKKKSSTKIPRSRSKSLLNVLKMYAYTPKKKNPYKAFSDLYTE